VVIKFSTSELKRFWQAIIKRGENDCWEWTRCHDKDGYPIFHVTGKWIKAHRLLCKLTYGRSGKMTCHTCHNPGCMNPKHLYPGNGKMNSQDRDRAGRANISHGIKHYRAVLTPKQVKQIRQLHLTGLGGLRIARIVGCSKSMAEKVYNNITWKHIL
jgi:hypothetical protein